MSRWTHAQCEACWIMRNTSTGEGGVLSVRRPHRLIEDDDETGVCVCCFCGRFTIVGIFVRENPAALLCQGSHAND